MVESKKVLVFEENDAVSSSIRTVLEKERFNVQTISDKPATALTIQEHQPDLVLLDGFYEGHDECRICRELKCCPLPFELKVIIMSERSQQADVLTGFASGADDYIIKPLRLREFAARVKSVLRRRNPAPLGKHRPQALKRGPLEINSVCHEARLHNMPLSLTISEFRLLHLMANAPGRVYSRSQLSDELSGFGSSTRESTTGSRHIDVHIRALRQKLQDFHGLIQTMRGVGYFFALPSTAK